MRPLAHVHTLTKWGPLFNIQCLTHILQAPGLIPPNGLSVLPRKTNHQIYIACPRASRHCLNFVTCSMAMAYFGGNLCVLENTNVTI